MMNTDLSCFSASVFCFFPSLVSHRGAELRTSLWVWIQFLENEEVVREGEEEKKKDPLPCKSIIVQDTSEIQL